MYLRCILVIHYPNTRHSSYNQHQALRAVLGRWGLPVLAWAAFLLIPYPLSLIEPYVSIHCRIPGAIAILSGIFTAQLYILIMLLLSHHYIWVWGHITCLFSIYRSLDEEEPHPKGLSHSQTHHSNWRPEWTLIRPFYYASIWMLSAFLTLKRNKYRRI